MIIFEHTASAFLIGFGLVAAAALSIFSYLRFVNKTPHTLAILLIRLLFLALLGWCLFLPGKRESKSEILKPRFIVAIDTSDSMDMAPPEQGPSRRDVTMEMLQMKWTDFVGAECDIDVYAFATDVGGRISLDAALDLTPDGQATLLHDCLEEIISRYAGQNVSGLLLLSDGIDTREANDSWASAAWSFPVYTARLEPEMTRAKEPDVRIDSVHTPRRVTVGWNTELSVVVSGEGTGGKAQNVQLFRNDVLIDEMPIQIPAGGGAKKAEFELENPEIGTCTYRVYVPPLDGESNEKDNEYQVSVLVVDADNRLLYVEGLPRWESKYLTRTLRANKQVAPLGFIKGPQGNFMHFGTRGSMTTDMREDQLTFFKIVILGNLAAEDIGPDRARNLVRFVETGGSLILLGGTQAWGPDGFIKTGLKRIMPVKSWNPQIVEGKFPVQLTDAGRTHAAFASTDPELWNILPPVLSLFPGATLSMGAEQLVTASASTGPETLIASHRYGDGKVAVILTDSLWKWFLNEKALDTAPYQRFWNQLLSWAMPERDEIDIRELDLWTDREQVFLGEEIDIKARQTRKETDDTIPVVCEITTSDERRMSFTMTPEPVTVPSGKSYPGFAVTFKAEQPGIHEAVAVLETDGKRIESDPVSFFVKPYTPESIPRSANIDILKLLAQSSGGKYFSTGSDLNDELSSLSFVSKEQEQVEYRSLWEKWPVISVLLALLSAGWILRKLRNMP